MPELAVRRAVHALGLRYRVDARPVPDLARRADLVFPGARVAVFIDGCFWHGCPYHYVASKSNAGYWAPKIEANRRRDAETTALLAAREWRVLRFWAHEEVQGVAERIVATVRAGK